MNARIPADAGVPFAENAACPVKKWYNLFRDGSVRIRGHKCVSKMKQAAVQACGKRIKV